MVRRSELACRDDWSRSLWQPTTGGQDEPGPQYSRSPLIGPMPPTSQQDLTTLLAQDIVSAGVSGEDVLLSEARIISEPEEAKNRWETPARPIHMPNFDPRTAIFRAREAYRDKVKAKATEARMLSSAEPIAEPMREAIVTSTETRDLAVEFEQTEALIPERSPEYEPRNAFKAAPSTVPPVSATITTTLTAGVEYPHADRKSSQNGAAPAVKKNSEKRLSQPAVDVFVPEGATSTPMRANDVVRTAVPMASDLPEWYRTDLPRVCRTCRDYRPSADGARGWCANAWAFTHRRLVQSDDSAPCHSAIGDWWAPVDDVWLVAADVSSHGRATPHLDRITGQETARRRRS